MDQSPQLLQQQQQLKVTPKQIAASYILQLSSLELQEVIEQELVENPALDMTEVPVCPLCGNQLTGRVCQNCFGTAGAGLAREDSLEPLKGTNLLGRDEEDDELDPIVRAESGQTLAEYLMWNLRAIPPRDHHAVAEYLVGNLDEGGYLRVALDEAMAATHTSRELAQAALEALHSIEPSGIGARDTRE